MPFTYTAAKSSRVTKSRSGVASLKRSSSSPFSQSPKRKPISRSQSKQENFSDYGALERLRNIGLVTSLAAPGQPQDIISLLGYIKTCMFDDIPERAGMNSVRIAEVLNFRKALPPMVSKSHIHALVFSPTSAEREIASLAARDKLQKVVIQGRSVSASTAYEALVLVSDWIEATKAAKLEPSLTERYTQYLRSDPSQAFTFTQEETISLFRAGLLISAASMTGSANVYDSTSSTTMTSIASISKAASGSLAAVGGSGAFHGAGGGGTGGLQSHSSRKDSFRPSLPNTGVFLKLVNGATEHLMHLLSKSKYSEAPMSLLRERWNGGVSTDNAVRKATGFNKDPFAEVLPGRTKKWKLFYGLKFEWVLAECLGAGLLEVFETGTVGKGVRAI